MDDGWDDDDEIDLSQDADGSGDVCGDDGNLNFDQGPTSSKETYEADGWGDDDDDLNFENDDALNPVSSNPPPPPPLPPPQPSQPEPSVHADGWSDGEGEDDLLNFDDGFDDESKTTPPADTTLAANSPTGPEDGWGDEEDDDLNFDDEDENLNMNTTKYEPPNNNKVNQSVQSGWGSDDDFFGDDDDLVQTTRNDSHMMNPKREQLLRELKDYVNSLDRMLSSINAVLEYEYNTPQKAMELADYYRTRENLAEYTRSKEISRMDYRVVLPNGDVVMDKQQIAANFLPNESLVARCSNQSLLADVLQVITGKDLLVRPQFMAICVAHACKFTIHLGDGLVDCACQLRLSMPKADGQPLNIANIHVSIVFAPDQPMIQYRVNAIDVLLEDYGTLSSTADFLMECQTDELVEEDLQHAPADIYRDQFLANSQKFFAQSTIGMKSAWQEMESVVNIQQKFKFFKQFIPNTDAMLAAEQEAMELARAREQQQQQHGLFPPPAQHARSLPPPADQTNRPQSILGGLVRSGWGKLANSVHIPDDDPAIYGQEAPPFSLYHRDEPPRGPQQQHQVNLSQGFRRPPPSPAPPQKKEQQVNLSSGFPRSPPHQAMPRKQKNQPVDLSKGFPRPPSSPGPPKKKEPQQVELSKSFPRPPPSPMQPKKEGPPPSLMEPRKEEQEVDLSKGFPRSSPSPMQQQRPPTAPPTSRSDVSESLDNMQDGWQDDSLDDDVLDLLDEQSPEKKIETSETVESSQIPAQQSAMEEVSSLQATFPEPVDKDFVYNPEDDIIPTLKRWVNPRPHRPYVVC
jgi:hypothetical protein